MSATSNTSSNKTAGTLLTVLEAFASQPQAVMLSDLARQLEMNVSTLYRYTSTLQQCGYVNQLKDGRYEISLKVCYLADLVQKHQDTSVTLHRFVQEASVLFSESAHIAVEDNHMIVYTDNVVSTARTITIRQHIGKTAPMYVTGIGKLLLSEFSDAELSTYIEQTGLRAYTGNTVTTREALLKEFEFIRENGFVYDNEECEIGVRCVAVPIRNYTGKIICGLSISGPTARLTDEVIAANIDALKDIARRASAALGYGI